MKRILLLCFFFSALLLSGQENYQDTIKDIENRISVIEKTVDRIERDQLNYQIEKDLLKEAFSKNYETINIVITIILAVFAAIGYFGLKDISSIKKEYSAELEVLKQTKHDFISKSDQLDSQKNVIAEEIKKIIEENESQNKKLKLLELKEKISKFLDENKLYSALEYIPIAIELAPTDVVILNYKARILTRLFQLEEALKTLKEAYDIDPKHESIATNYIECLFFANRLETAQDIINQNKELYENKANGGLKIVGDLFSTYHSKELKDLVELIKNIIDFEDLEIQKQRFAGWQFKEAIMVTSKFVESDKRNALGNVLVYLDGQLSGEILCKRIGIDPQQTNK